MSRADVCGWQRLSLMARRERATGSSVQTRRDKGGDARAVWASAPRAEPASPRRVSEGESHVGGAIPAGLLQVEDDAALVVDGQAFEWKAGRAM